MRHCDDAAGYAFADAHVDPRSGEVTSAQVFFPSAFIEANVPKRIRLIEGAQDVAGHAHFQVGFAAAISRKASSSAISSGVDRFAVLASSRMQRIPGTLPSA